MRKKVTVTQKTGRSSARLDTARIDIIIFLMHSRHGGWLFACSNFTGRQFASARSRTIICEYLV
jgi:hypothetical protein